MKSKLYVVPCPISEATFQTIPQYVIDIVHKLDHFIVERAKTARKFLKFINHPISMSDIIIEEMDKHDESYGIGVFHRWVKEGKVMGIISEAGCPGIADPGAQYVHLAHKINVEVIPLVGPSSIFLALMASGMNGQSFSFHGYLPNKKEQVQRKLKELDSISKKRGSAEIFIETPYRNKSIFQDIMKYCSPGNYLCIAADITGPSEFVKKKKISEWKSIGFPLKDKIPAIFIIG